ncbi:DUF1501 domain-containing protein [Stieleria varia]|uniref:DUF1501 domain-containing protein n=1 Tax=Stieleria varia TaxID=2528005 RepID=A0A5C6AXT8_9BACT|nr:DUF1501 domain-containing protein [Stieleria varia]TWU04448.1 hypothetical protein Pla52n_24890 [Stieleria varia]
MSRSDSPSSLASRRSMLKAAAGCGMMTNTSLMATLLGLQATKSVMAANDTSGYKAIVCLFLFGGNDSYNMLIPRDGDSTSGEYGHYHDSRGGFDYVDGNGVQQNQGGLALEQSSLVPLNPDGSGRSFGLSPGMAADEDPNASTDPAQRGVAGLYNTGKLAFVANIGSLIDYMTATTYASTQKPLGLFSHADLQRHWMSGVPQTRNGLTGWGGRLADAMQATNQNPSVSMNISIGGVNLFQTGGSVIPYTITASNPSGSTPATPATVVAGYSPDLSTTNYQNRIFSRNINGFLDQTYSNLLSQSLVDVNKNSIDAAIAFNEAVNTVTVNTPFNSESPSSQMETIARVIGANSVLQQGRQVFFVSLGGWDNHGDLMTAHEGNLSRVSRALTSFYHALEELGLENDVLTFTASDFARTLSTNGKGSDHAWGGNQIVMGGGINGGKIYGQFPTSLAMGTDIYLNRGRLIPTTSVDSLAAEIAMWFGISNGPDLVDILPNIRTFYGAGETTTPLQMFG